MECGLDFIIRYETGWPEAYKKALNLDPNYEDALHALAMAYVILERLDEANEIGKELIEAEPRGTIHGENKSGESDLSGFA